ncbi:undecaprenyl/decaprenyl-phosphate alpha-N-acetylglucosaminyl 1-phosphate transferase [bacterium]|nr:undecaprenyl/decaprenyl-phosphate alpha-N-acetylglucosaminyl 1-phosphate transferase [bacterium]
MTYTIIAVKLFFTFIISFLFAFYLIPIIRNVAFRLNILDVPDGKVKKHKKATPYLGGIAIYIAFITSLSLTMPFANKMFSFFIGITLLLFIGLIDDLVPLKPYQKFSGQIIAALCFLRAGFYFKSHFFHNYWAIPISFFWILTVVNAFNLVDVMDGLATTIASCAAFSFLIIALYVQQPVVAIVLCAFLGSLLAFFYYNKPQATIYLGDTGSLFIGGLLATIPFMINWGRYNWYGYIAPVIILAIPLLEVATLILVRTYKKIPFYQASPDHFSIYLQKKGWSKNFILFYIFILSIILFVSSFLFMSGVIGFLTLFIIGFIFLVIWVIGITKKV